MDQADFPGDTIGYINFASFLIGTPIIDAYQLKLAVPGVHHADEGAKGKVRVRRREGFAVEALAVGGFVPVESRAVPTGITHPGLNRLHGLIQMCYEGCLHRRSDEEHKKYPAQCSPAHEKSMSHSVFFVLLGSKKVKQKRVIMSTIFCEEFVPYLIQSKRFSFK